LRALTLRSALFSLATAALLATAGYLAWNTRPTDDRARTEVAAQLRTLNTLDARWDIATLAARTDPRPLAQAELNLVPAIERAFADLQQLSSTLGSPALVANLPGLASALEDKGALGAQIGREARALGDALSRAIGGAVALGGAAQGETRLRDPGTPVARAAERFSAELLAFWGSAGSDRRAAVEAALESLGLAPSVVTSVATSVAPRSAPAAAGAAAAGADRGAELIAVRSAAKTVLEGKPALESAITRFSLSSVGPRLSALTTDFTAEVQTGLERQQLFRTYLLFYSAALLVLLAWIASRLIASYRVIAQVNDELKSANETLEDKVRLRTRELSGALAELKASEAQLIQSEKMSSLGQMVAGIAHEINTPVAYVKNSLGSVDTRLERITGLTQACETLLVMLDAGDTTDVALDRQLAQLSGAARELGGSASVGELGRLVKDGLYGVDQIGQIVNHLRDFSRLDRGDAQRFDLHLGIDSTLLLARHLLKAVQVEKAFTTDGSMNGSPSQINQVLLNLITNAAQAIGPGGGTIRIATSGDASRLIVQVSDTGSGIPPEVLPKIFDPFFTTKPVGQGTGLGLSVSYKIVAQHGGRIDVRSQPGRGTTFRIELPRSGSVSRQAAVR